MNSDNRKQELTKRVIDRQTTYDQLPATSTEHDQILEQLEEALHDLAEHQGASIEEVTAELEHHHMLNISY